MFDKVRDIYRLQKQAKQIKKELTNIHIEAEAGGVLITVNGEMEVIKVVIPPELMSADNAEKVGNLITEAANKAIKKAQQIAAEKMKAVMGDMQGMLGGGN